STPTVSSPPPTSAGRQPDDRSAEHGDAVRSPDLRADVAELARRHPARGGPGQRGGRRPDRGPRRPDPGRRGTRADVDRDVDPRRRHHRRPVHRDQGGVGRPVRPGGPPPRPPPRAGPPDADRRRRRRGPAAARLADPGAELTPVEQAVAEAHQEEWATVVAATVRVVRDIDVAEEAVQDAYV